MSGCVGHVRTSAVWVEIPSDAPVRAVAESLYVHGVIDSTSEFERLAIINRRYLDIRPGFYLLRKGTSAWQVLTMLRGGMEPATKVVVRERMTLSEAAAVVEQATGIPQDSFVEAASDPFLRISLGAHAETVEGYLYPTVYYVPLSIPPALLVRQMTDSFVAHWNPAWDARLDSLGLTRDQAVNLASIIAGEMPHPDDLGRIAAVYRNRLALGMPLQADPTVVYALGQRRRLTFADYRIQSSYNTYKIQGLPPGPIGEPSVVSLGAALYPSDSQDLFFVGRFDGRHEFSRTYQEHLQTIARLRGKKTTVRHAVAAMAD